MTEMMNETPETIRSFIRELFEDQKEDLQEIKQLSEEHFNISSKISKWAERKNGFLLKIHSNDQSRENIERIIEEEITTSSNDIIEGAHLKRLVKNDYRYKNLHINDELYIICVSICDDVKTILDGRRYEVKNLLDYKRWMKGFIDN